MDTLAMHNVLFLSPWLFSASVSPLLTGSGLAGHPRRGSRYQRLTDTPKENWNLHGKFAGGSRKTHTRANDRTLKNFGKCHLGATVTRCRDLPCCIDCLLQDLLTFDPIRGSGRWMATDAYCSKYQSISISLAPQMILSLTRQSACPTVRFDDAIFRQRPHPHAYQPSRVLYVLLTPASLQRLAAELAATTAAAAITPSTASHMQHLTSCSCS